MLYTLLTEHEIDAIEVILKEHSIRYEILVNEELINEQNESMKHVVDHRGQVRRTNALYNLVIEKDEFNKIPTSFQTQLERYNIFPDLTDISLHADTHFIDASFNTVKSKSSWTVRIFSILGLCILFGLGLVWVDNYVIQVFPSSAPEIFYGNKRMFDGKLFE